MYFIVQIVGENLGVASRHDTQEEAETKAEELSKTAPGTFVVAKGLAVWRPSPVKETLA